MRRPFTLGLAVLVVFALGSTPALAAGHRAVTIDARTTFDDVPDTFVATGLPGCEGGTVETGPGTLGGSQPFGLFAGFKVFTCNDADNGLVLRLNAMFDATGSVGVWNVVDGWGTLDGVRGRGTLIGEPITGGVLDHYTGTVKG